jgi:RND family efflux transporter MFP subunit
MWPAVLIALVGCALTIFLVTGEKEGLFSEVTTTTLSVKTLDVKKTDYRVQVPAWGLVEPRETIDIRTEIAGKVTHVSDRIFAGATVKQGAHLFSLDARGYRNKLAEASAALKQARQALAIEKGRQIIAKYEWKLLEKSQWQGNRNKALALRVPQIKEREAALQIATARQSQALLDIERTRVVAPCDGVILAERLAMGQVLDTGYTAMQIACTDCYRLKAMFAPGYFLDEAVDAVTIEIGPNRYMGVVKAVLPRIDPETRQKRALVEFKGKHVSLGAYAGLVLPGPRFKNVTVLPRDALRSGNSVWILNKNGTLEIRAVSVPAQDVQNIVISEGLTEGDRVILSHIAGPLQGMPLRMQSPHTEDPRQIAVGRE